MFRYIVIYILSYVNYYRNVDIFIVSFLGLWDKFYIFFVYRYRIRCLEVVEL